MLQELSRGALIASWVLVSISRASAAEVLPLERGDRICLVGNELGERMQHDNCWETLLHQRFPEQELVVRNLCFPGDEPFHRERSLNFGDPDTHLAHSRASVILFFFGFNESFGDSTERSKFAEDLTRLVAETKTKNYSGNGPPRLVLISPIACEDTGDPNLPSAIERNFQLEACTAEMRQVAGEAAVAFVDVFTPTKQLFEVTKDRLTLDGAHLNDAGYRALAPILDRALFGDAGAAREINELLRAAIADKNFHWWHRYRAVNGYSIYGTRGEAGSDGTYRNREVMEREREILDQMCANRDRRIWAIAQGHDVPAAIDDSNTLPFIAPKTNVGGDNDPNKKAGKLGSLDYIPAAEQQKLFKLAPGYEIQLVASEEDFPELAKPVALNFDNRGRLWVSTMPSYPQWQPKSKLDDKLLILEDINGDGRSDVCKVFAGGLHQPTGFELGYGGAFVAQQPDILFLQDTDGDDVADVRIRKLVGFDTADSHHGLAAFEWGPDGALYFQEGTFKQSQVETPYGVRRLSDAGVWRYEPRTERLDVHVSLAFANPWGHVFDRWGQNFVADASPGFNYWAAPISGYVAHPDKHPGGSRANHLDWGGSKAKGDIATFIVKRTRPSSGCELISSRHFPPPSQGNFLLNNVIGERAILQHTVADQGSGFVGTEVPPLLACDDGNFRPVDLQFGPDGALYIVDWHNALIGHLQHNLREPNRDHTHGRIWRVVYKDRPLLTPPKIAGQPLGTLLDLLREPEDRTRYRVRRELAARNTAEVTAALQNWMAELDSSDGEYEHLLLEALWLHQTHNVVNEALLARVLESPDFQARAAATRVLSHWYGSPKLSDPFKMLLARARDTYPRVRLEAVRACSFIHAPRSIEVALEVLNQDMDEYLEYTLSETLRVVEEAFAGPPAADHSVFSDPFVDRPRDALESEPAPLRMEHAEHAGHAAHDHAGAAWPPPIVFLDKPEPVVRYQLDRLTNAQLLSLERNTDDPKYKLVSAAVLARPGLSRQDREAALNDLCALNNSNPVRELLQVIEQTAAATKRPAAAGPALEPARIIGPLAALLLKQPSQDLATHRAEFQRVITSAPAAAHPAAFAGLIAGGDAAGAWQLAQHSAASRIEFLSSVALLPDTGLRDDLRDEILACLDASQSTPVREAAIGALAHVASQATENFQLVAPLVGVRALRASAVHMLSRVSKDARPPADARRVIETLVKHAESTPAAQRTTDDFLDAMQLADELLALLPVNDARQFRQRLRETVVRVVRISTVEEEMRYDTPYFAVEAGRPIQLVLRNDDLMPHNLVITVPGAMQAVAEAAADMSPQFDAQGRQYVPQTDQILFATKTVDTRRQDVLTFTAPTTPGEYPYVCTFPRHWMRMYGVMVVVEDLDAWLADAQPPADPLGLSRSFVKNWSVNDLHSAIPAGLQGRTPTIGQQIFKDATCAQCHKVHGAGGAVGPELAGLLARWKGSHADVLREVLDPSHKVEPKYTLYNVVTTDGQIVTGVITAEDRDTVTVVSNPEKPLPQVIRRTEIEELVKTSSSLMPKGLLDRFSQDEIFELLVYITSDTSTPKQAGEGEH